MKQNDTKTAILDAAEALCASKGLNGFSYQDIAREIGIKTASIHYHFAGKSVLLVAMMQRHRQALVQTCQQIVDDAGRTPQQKLRKLVDSIIDATLKRDGRMCLGAMLAIDCAVIDATLTQELTLFFESLEGAVTLILQQAQVDRPAEIAGSLIALLEGTLLLSRLGQQAQRLKILRRRVDAIFS